MDIEFLNGLGIDGENADAVLKRAEAEIGDIKLGHIIENELRERKVKNIDAAMKLFDRTGLEYSDDKVEGLFERLEMFKEENDFLFENVTPKTVFSAPVNNATKSVTREEFEKMGYNKRLKLFKEQPEVYKQFTE